MDGEMESSQRSVLWTASFDYYGTGEGRTIAGWIGYAKDEAECRRKCGEVLDPFIARGAQCLPGLIRNEIVRLLWSEQTLELVERAIGRANVSAHSQLHFNYS
jgi:hypothetical protein